MSTALPSASAKPRACPGWGSLTLGDLLDKWASKRADAVFVRSADGSTLTYRQTHQRVAHLAQALADQNLKRGDTVLVRAGRRVEGLLFVLAAWRLGLNVCLASEPLSARQIIEGGVSYAPKMAVDAGVLASSEANDLRIMDVAASLFTVRVVGCFGNAPDGVIDLDVVDGADDLDISGDLGVASSSGETAVAPLDPNLDGQLQSLHIGTDGAVERFSRTQITLLSQALACAMQANLSPQCTLGTAYDPGAPHGLLAAALPVLLVGATLELFDPLDPSLDARLQLWHADDMHHRLVLPAVLAQQPAFRDTIASASATRVWLCPGPVSAPLPPGDALLVDCAGTALLPATVDADGNTFMRPGAIVLHPSHGQPLSFGTLRLEGGKQSNATQGSLMIGAIALESPLAAMKNGKKAQLVLSGQMAKVAEDEDRKPIYQLVSSDGDAYRIGPHYVLLSTLNRALGLTGRWQDAAVFAVTDPLMGHRIEVAVEPRSGDDDAHKLPTLDMVRSMLRESGIGDAALPVKLHLVTRIPRRGRGVVDVAALPGYVIHEDGEPVSDVYASQAVA